jgi:poly(A) polymerase
MMIPASWLPDWLHDPLIQACSGIRVWLVGGAIRNALLGLETIDFDFAVEGAARDLARLVANSLGGYYYELDRNRDTGRVIFVHENNQRVLLDFARLRGERIEHDLKDRDFTINALAVELSKPDKVLDTTGGLQDLKDKVLRLCNPNAILADPVRGLRAVRMSVQYELTIDPAALSAICADTIQLTWVSPERIRDEFFRLMEYPFPGRAIRLMDHLGQLSVLFPQLVSLRDLAQPPPHEFSAFDHTLAVLDHLGKLLIALGRKVDPDIATELVTGEIVYRLGGFREGINLFLDRELSHGRNIRQLLFLAALYHDAGKPACFTLQNGQIHFYGHESVGAEIIAEKASDLRLSNIEIQWLETLIRNHMRPMQLERDSTISHRATFRFLRDTNDAGIGVVLLSLADLLGQQTPPVDQEALSRRVETARHLLSAMFEAPVQRYHPDPFLRGNEIMKVLDLEPGPEIGRILNALQEAQVAGEVNSEAEAYAFIRSLHQGHLGMDSVENQ